MEWYWSWNSNTWPPDAKTWLIRKTPMLQKIEGRRRTEDENRNSRGWDGWMASPTLWTWVLASSRSWWTGKTCVLQIHGVSKIRTQLSDWVELGWLIVVLQYLDPHLGRFNPGTDYTTWVSSQEVSSLSSDETRLIRMISNFKDSV